MPQPIWALSLLLVAFVVAALDGKLASGAIGQELYSSRRNTGKKSNAVYPSTSPAYLKQPKPNTQLLKTVEQQLLAMFGLNSRPKPTNNVTVSDYMWEMYKKQNKLNRGLSSRTNTIRCFRGKEKDHSHPHQASYKFNVRNIPDHEIVWAAELVIFNGPSTSTSFSGERRPSHRINIYDVVRQSTNQSADEPILRLVDTQFLKASKQSPHSRWLSFDVLPALHRWRNKPSTNHGLFVEIVSTSLNSSTSATHQLRLKRQTNESRRQWLQYQPLLVTYSRDSSKEVESVSHRRTRRNTRKHRRKGRKDNCRRHALYVDFSDVGWNDWIVAPPGYNAYFCGGECPFPLADHLNSTNHAIVQTLVNSVNPAAVPRVCCVPTELSPISMLYVDEYDKVVLKNYQDMVVQGCGCR